jgi:predicted  nucleic acid-binding Zn-ribbon protein
MWARGGSMATTDIRLKRIEKEYQSVRGVQDDILDKMDSYEAALLGLTEMVAENQRQIAELNEKMDRLMTHLDVPPRPPAGFVKE